MNKVNCFGFLAFFAGRKSNTECIRAYCFKRTGGCGSKLTPAMVEFRYGLFQYKRCDLVSVACITPSGHSYVQAKDAKQLVPKTNAQGWPWLTSCGGETRLNLAPGLPQIPQWDLARLGLAQGGRGRELTSLLGSCMGC